MSLGTAIAASRKQRRLPRHGAGACAIKLAQMIFPIGRSLGPSMSQGLGTAPIPTTAGQPLLGSGGAQFSRMRIIHAFDAEREADHSPILIPEDETRSEFVPREWMLNTKRDDHDRHLSWDVVLADIGIVSLAVMFRRKVSATRCSSPGYRFPICGREVPAQMSALGQKRNSNLSA